jgi:hypothetical protein
MSLKAVFEAFELVKMDVHCRVIDPPRAVVHWRGMFRAKNGQLGETDVLDLIEVRDGRIASLTTFFDTAYAAALSAPPYTRSGIGGPLPRPNYYSLMTRSVARRENVRAWLQVMPPAITALASRFSGADGLSRQTAWRAGLIALPHVVALAILLATEDDIVSKAAFALAWGVLNCFWLVLLRRPGLAGAVSLMMIVVLVLLSQLKHSVLFMTVNFVDLMIIDWDTIGFPPDRDAGPRPRRDDRGAAGAAGDRHDLVVRSAARARAHRGVRICRMSGRPVDAFDAGAEHFRQRILQRAVCLEVRTLRRDRRSATIWCAGCFESDARIVGHLRPVAETGCHPARKPPHIVMVFDESSFDATNMPGTKVPPGYARHFTSFDGKQRGFVVEGAGGPSWFTEYNVLTGLSVRSYGRFADFVTRIAAGRVERGLPWALRRCGYRTYSLYSFLGAFLSAKRFQESAGIENFYDSKVLGATGVEPDGFFYDAAAGVIAANRNKDPLFLFVYTIANHFPWDYRFRPDLTPDWRGYGNTPEVDEYLRRQMLSARAYEDFTASCARIFRLSPSSSCASAITCRGLRPN